MEDIILNTTSENKDYDTLVLPGGGIKGFYILGALQCLYDKQLVKNVTNYIGTSVGSMLCYLLCIGYTPTEIIVSLYTNRWLEKVPAINLVSLANGTGATNFSAFTEALEKMTIEKLGYYPTLGKIKEKLNKTFVCVTYNMTTCNTEYLHPNTHPDLPCLTAIRMSCNIPLIFERFRYLNNYYIDGGMSDNFAIIYAETIGNKILGLHLQVDENSVKDEPSDGMMMYFIRLLQIPILQSTKNKLSLIKSEKTQIITIKSGNLRNMLDFRLKSKEQLEMFSSGYTSINDFYK